MNISEQVRQQTALTDSDGREERKAFLAAIVKAAGSFTLKSKAFGMILESKSLQPVVTAVRLFKELYGVEVEFGFSTARKLYSATIKPDRAMEIFEDLLPRTAQSESGLGIWLSDDKAAAAYVRGLFATNGSAYVPDEDSDGYHIEFRFFDEGGARELAKFFADRGIVMHVTARRDYYLAYSKSGADVSGILAFMGAYESVFALNDLMMLREANNNINRGVNCSLANMDKAQRAATELIEAARALKESGEWARLDDKLKEVCEAREAHPDLTMSQLAQRLGISKSGLNHRIQKILKEAQRDDREANGD